MENNIEVNAHGVMKYPKGDTRRLFVLLAAIATLDRPTISSLSEYTGQNKGKIDSAVDKINAELGVKIEKIGPVFILRSWGDLLNKDAVLKFIPPQS